MTAQLSPLGVQKFYDNNGNPLAFGLLYSYAAGTTNPQATYVDSTQTTQNTNPIQLNFRGECNLWLDPTLTYKLLLTDSAGNTVPNWPVDNIPGGPFITSTGSITIPVNLIPTPTNTFTLGNSTHSWAQLYLGANAEPALDTVTGIIGYFPRTTGEISASVTPVNFSYPPGYVDRYATNTTPGTTDMSSAFTSAVQVAAKLGCIVRWGVTAPYRLNNPVNCTGIHGVVFNDESSGSVSNSAFISINVGHSGHAFDLATSYECTFNNLAVGTVGGSVPKSIFFCARNVAGSDAGLHRFNNLRTASNCTCSFIYYGYGSEQNHFINCCVQNAQAGATLFSHNATNPSSYTSTFVSIATGSQSNAEHRHIGGSYFNFGNSGSHNEYVFALDNAVNFTFRDGLWGCAHGGGYVNAQLTASLNVTFDSIRGEPLGTQPLHGVDILATSGTFVGWTFNNVTGDASGFFLAMASSTTIQNLAMRASTNTSGNLVSAYNLSASIIETMQDSVVGGQAGGTISGNLFIGGRNNVQSGGAGTWSGNLYADNNGGVFGIDSDAFTSTLTACTGALTVNSQYTVRLMPNGKTVVLSLAATVGTATAASNFSFGVALPVQYRPAANLRQLVIIEDNGTTPNQPGQAFINASTGVISIFKDLIGTNFTAAPGAGLPGLTEISWNL